mgnify:CR=1 FL=1
MREFLTTKKIKETKTAEGKKLYTVSRLRTEVRSLIKEANKILYDLDRSQKSQYLKQYAADIEKNLVRSGKDREGFVQMDVKFMRSKQLRTVYNALTALINADKESVEYAQKLADRKQEMYEKTKATLGKKNLTFEEYETMYTIWQQYSDVTDTYEYRELIEYIQKSGKKPGAIIDDIKRAEGRLKQFGLDIDNMNDKGIVLKYLTNEGAIESAMAQLADKGYQGSMKSMFYEANKLIGRQK